MRRCAFLLTCTIYVLTWPLVHFRGVLQFSICSTHVTVSHLYNKSIFHSIITPYCTHTVLILLYHAAHTDI